MDLKNFFKTIKGQSDVLIKKKTPEEIEADFEETMHKVDTFEARVEIPREKAKAKLAAKKTQGIVRKAMEAAKKTQNIVKKAMETEKNKK